MTRHRAPAEIMTDHMICKLLGTSTPSQELHHSARHDIIDHQAGRMIVDIFGESIASAARGCFLGRVYSWRDGWTAWYEIRPKNPNEPFPRKRRAKETRP